MSALTYGSPEEAGMDAGRIAKLKVRAPELVDGFRARSAVMLAARRGKIIYHEAFGPLTDKPDSSAMLKDSIFSTSSISKPFVGVALLMLLEDGLLGLNRPIREYLPEICGEGTDDIELQHLLTHSSGFGEEECWAQFHAEIGNHIGDGDKSDLQKYLAAMWSKGIDMPVAAQANYNNHGFALLTEIINRVSGIPAHEFIGSRILDPLGMTDTSCWRDPEKVDRQMVRGEYVPFGSHPKNPFIGHEDPWMGGSFWGYMGINSTAIDLARFGQMLLDGGKWNGNRLLSNASVHEITRVQTEGLKVRGPGPFDGKEATFGYGWFVQGNDRWTWMGSNLNPVGSFAHSGAGGHTLWVDPINEIVGVFLSVCLDIDFEAMAMRTNTSLFQDMVTAAVE